MASSHFFRILLQSNLKDRKLVIPKEFLRNYGKFISSPVRLILPNGVEWNVELTTIDGVVCLHKGWHDFAKHYSLQLGSLLVFRFDGNSVFRTMIFDLNGLEIEYSSNCTNGYEASSDEDSVIILDNFPSHTKKRGKASLTTSHQPFKKMKNESSFRPKMEHQGYNYVRENGEGMAHNSVRRTKDGVATARRKQPLFEKAVKVVQSSRVSKSEKPCFVIVMQRSHVHGRFSMKIPNKFAREYLNNKGGSISIEDSKGRSWSMVYKWTHGQTKFVYIKSNGWKRFALDNFLKMGHICVFQLIHKNTFLFTKQNNPSIAAAAQAMKVKSKIKTNVRIKAEGGGNADHYRHVTQKASSPTTKYMPKNPYFEVDLLTRLHKLTIMTIPASFAREHLRPEMESAKLQMKNKEWKVKILQHHDYGVFRFSGGWSAFYRESSLVHGNKCFFELVNKKDCTFRVTVF